MTDPLRSSFAAPANPPTRVLHVLSGAGGGSTLSTIELARELTSRGYEAHAVCHSFQGLAGERQDLLDAFEGRVAFVPMYFWNERIRTAPWKRPLVVARQELSTAHGLRSASALRSILQDRRIDLVHSATFVIPDGAVAARSLGLPHVFHVRELVGPDQPFRIRGEGAPLAKVLADPRSALVANSGATASLLADAAPGLEVEVVPNGLALERFAAVAAGRDPAAPVRVVAMVGHLHATWKRHDLFVDAASIVARAHPEIEFRIYGHRTQGAAEANAEAILARARAKGLEANFVLAGFVADPTTVMGACDVVVQPTSAESFGRVSVEAMAAGVAVVGVGEGPLGELVEHERSGLLAASATPEDLAAVIERVIVDDGLRSRMVAAARVRAHDLFSIERCADRMAAVYERQLAVGRGPGEPLARSWATFAAGRFSR